MKKKDEHYETYIWPNTSNFNIMRSFSVKCTFEKATYQWRNVLYFFILPYQCHVTPCIFCFHFYTAVKLCRVTFNESCTKFIVNIIIVNDNNINTKRLICFVKSCHFTSVVYTIVLLYQSQRRISRVNINQFCSVWRWQKLSDFCQLTIICDKPKSEKIIREFIMRVRIFKRSFGN